MATDYIALVAAPEETKHERADAIDSQDNGDALAEQEQRLLDSDDDDFIQPQKGRSWKWYLLVGFLVLASLTFLGLAFLLVKAVGSRGSTSVGSASGGAASLDSFRRPDSDYVLDSDWDFDAAPIRREYNWTIRDVTGNPDGVFRPMAMINDKFPGELIECNEGDTIVVNIENHSVNATAIHWHGLFQNGTNWQDGAPGVTQCPIAPGRHYRYEFTVTGQSGTYFYHGHQAAQHMDGLVGPLVIHSPKERKEYQQMHYATDRIVMLQDWYYDLSHGLLRESLSPGNEGSPEPNGALINGMNKVDCSSHPERKCDNSSAVLPVIELEAGQNHRLRFLNAGGFSWFEVSVDGHLTLPLTEIDGVDIEPAPEPKIVMSPGQRYSAVLSANQTSENDAFWLRAKIITHCFGEKVLPQRGAAEAKAIVRYTAASTSHNGRHGDNDHVEPDGGNAGHLLPSTDKNPGISTVECRDMRSGANNSYSPIPRIAAPARADRAVYLRTNLAIGDWRLERGFFNDSSFRPDLALPTLHRIVDGLGAGNESFAGPEPRESGSDGNVEPDSELHTAGINTAAFDRKRELVLSTRGIETIDIILQNVDEGNHPFHMHGTKFWVLSAGHGYFPGYDALGLEAPVSNVESRSVELHGGLRPEALANPIRRDVATVEGFGWLLLRLVADNPGVWLMHCHMIWHGESGMAMELAARTDVMRGWEVPEAARELCAAGRTELEKGAVPKDEIWFGNLG